MSAELYDRAIALLERCAGELQIVRSVTLPTELYEAWEERHALAETLKTLPLETRIALASVYRDKLVSAEPYSKALDTEKADPELLSDLGAFFELCRRAALLA